MPFDTALLLPLKKRVRGQLCPSVADHHAGVTAHLGDPADLPRHADAGDRVIGDRCEAFPAEVV